MRTRPFGRLDRRVLTAGVGAVLVLTAGSAAVSASASTGTVPGSDTAAAVQAVLDRVLGAGSTVVTVSDTVQTSSGVTTVQRFGSGAPTAVQSASTTSAGGATTTTVVQQDAVSGTTTTVATPAGALVQQTVAVAVDRTRLGRRSLATIRALVASSAGIVPSRGDRLAVVQTTFAKPVVTAAPAPTVLSQLLPAAGPVIWALGGVAALAVLVVAFRGRRRAA